MFTHKSKRGPDIHLRQCSESDIQELSALVLNTCQAVNDPTDFSAEGRQAFESTASAASMAVRSQSPSLKVIRYGVALGYDPALVGMSEMFVDVESDSQEAWKILYIYVAGPAHGLGIGKLLLHRCLAHVPPGGVVKLRSAPSAVAFYQRFGFRICGPPTEPETHGIRGSPLILHIPSPAAADPQ